MFQDSNGYQYYIDVQGNRQYVEFDKRITQNGIDEKGNPYREKCDGIKEYPTLGPGGWKFKPNLEGYTYYKDKSEVLFRRHVDGRQEYAYSISQNIHKFTVPIHGVILIRFNNRYVTTSNKRCVDDILIIKGCNKY